MREWRGNQQGVSVGKNASGLVRDLSDILPPLRLAYLAWHLFEAKADASRALGLITPEGGALDGFDQLTRAYNSFPERSGLGRALIGESLTKMDVRAGGSLAGFKARALSLPVSWSVASVEECGDRPGAVDKSVLMFMALARCEPEKGGAGPVNVGLFGAYRFAGSARLALAMGRLPENGALLVEVARSAAEMERAAMKEGEAGLNFLKQSELTPALSELLNPAFYERMELARSVGESLRSPGKRGL